MFRIFTRTERIVTEDEWTGVKTVTEVRRTSRREARRIRRILAERDAAFAARTAAEEW